MHVRPIDPATATVTIHFHLEDPDLVDSDGGGPQSQVVVKGAPGQNLLEVALSHHINIEHSCGGVCACSTCHIYLEQGTDHVSQPSEAEEDRVEEAPGLQRNSRLSCQCTINGAGPISVRVPSWNRNAVKEVPH